VNPKPTTGQLKQVADELRQLTGLYVGVAGNRIVFPPLGYTAATQLAKALRGGMRAGIEQANTDFGDDAA
jgi:hypothetical protein